MKLDKKEDYIGKLYSELWVGYDKELFLDSVNIFSKRFIANNFNLSYLKGKRCLDVGCGGGRYSISMKLLGASEVIGIDIGEEGIEDARKRVEEMKLDNIKFKLASALKLPFDNNTFDFVCCSGVLMHLRDPDKGLEEIYRVLKQNCLAYFLVYATGGFRWPLIKSLRPITEQKKKKKIKKIFYRYNLPANKIRTYLDDFFVQYIDFYNWEDIQLWFKERGFTSVSRWNKGRLDHEEDIDSYIEEIEQLKDIFKKSLNFDDLNLSKTETIKLKIILNRIILTLKKIYKIKNDNSLKEGEKYVKIIGIGHNRFIAKK